ncbi:MULTISPECIES: hypothetical protein [Clostridia]|uniref:hypothetical protein n=1 Tax=Clostridia TaxID=186801 RepID=UPI001314BBCE|nr:MULTISPECIES: hypothetical protein [Clostridia]
MNYETAKQNDGMVLESFSSDNQFRILPRKRLEVQVGFGGGKENTFTNKKILQKKRKK